MWKPNPKYKAAFLRRDSVAPVLKPNQSQNLTWNVGYAFVFLLTWPQTEKDDAYSVCLVTGDAQIQSTMYKLKQWL